MKLKKILFKIPLILIIITYVYYCNLPNLNYCNHNQLQNIKGIGSKKANIILQNKPYKSFKDLEKLNGIGKKTVNKLKWKTKIRG